MNKIDNDKLLESMIKVIDTADSIKAALKDQGLEVKDGKVVNIINKPTTEDGKWFVCIKDYEATINCHFKKGKVYLVEGHFLHCDNGLCVKFDSWAQERFRLAKKR